MVPRSTARRTRTAIFRSTPATAAVPATAPITTTRAIAALASCALPGSELLWPLGRSGHSPTVRIDLPCSRRRHKYGLYATAKANCDLEKTAQKVGCETKKESLDLVHRTGDFANIDGSVSGTGALKLCFHDVHFTNAMDKLTLMLEVSGSAALDTKFKFVPLSLGHILCPLPWTADKDIDAAYDTDFNACNGLGSIDDAACEAEKGTQNGPRRHWLRRGSLNKPSS